MHKKIIKRGVALLVGMGLLLGVGLPAFGLNRTVNNEGDQMMFYTVQPGDTLWGLAVKRDLDRSLLAELNGLDFEERLYVGQVLKIPINQVITHEVQEGETVWRIAQNYHVDYRLIMRENEMVDPRDLKAGQAVMIPIPAERVASSIAPMRTVGKLAFWPVTGRVSSLFGMRDDRMHEGLDVAAPEGTPIYSVKSGVVEFAGPRGTYGNAVIVDHGEGLKTLYAHASEILVIEGEFVEQGQTIALVGNTGRSTGPHLHFEIISGGQPLDPSAYLPVSE